MKDSICSWGFGGRCKPPKKILRFGALRAVLRHYSRIINKTDKKCCFLHFGRGVQDPLSGDQGGSLDPWTPPLDPPQWCIKRFLRRSRLKKTRRRCRRRHTGHSISSVDLKIPAELKMYIFGLFGGPWVAHK